MVKYVLIDVDKTEYPYINNPIERIVFENKEIGDKNYVCEKCYRIFKTNYTKHLEKCDILYPFEETAELDIGNNGKIYFFGFEYGLNRKIMKSVDNMGNFSKLEQGISGQITTLNLLGKFYDSNNHSSHFLCLVYINYHKIVSYCFIQIYRSNLGSQKVVIRDIYTPFCYRGKKYATILLKTLSKKFDKSIDSLIFSHPVSASLQKVIKKLNINIIKVITNENFNSVRNINLK